MRNKIGVSCILTFIALLYMVPSPACFAVSSKIIRHKSSADLLKGKAEGLVISSRGTIQLGRAAETPVEEFEGFEDVWSINSIVVSGGAVYFGTSPNGGIYKYSLDKLTKIYPVDNGNKPAEKKSNDEDKSNGVKVEAEELLTNEHIFALAMDVSGRLLAGMSGKNCRLSRFEDNKMVTIYEPNDAKYIFAIAVDDDGKIYLGTGPEGKIYQLDSRGKKAQLLYDSLDKNILSLAVGKDGFIYAGTDGRGLVYKINTNSKEATVLYDTEQPEVTALLFTEESGESGLYAAATSAKIVQTQAKFAAQVPSTGRPDADTAKSKSAGSSEGGKKLKIPNTAKPGDGKTSQRQAPVRKGTKPDQASHIYKIIKDGFVNDIFTEAVVLFCLAPENGKLLAGSGNNAQLYSINPSMEQEAVIYEDEQATQLTAIAASGNDLYLGTSNPAKLIKLGTGFASEGTYTSDLVDASQPAKWGKLQLEADIPRGCTVKLACRSGNVKDVNDPTFSPWTELVEVDEPTQLDCPLGRFCQYKLVLHSLDGDTSPLIREIAVASTVPNLAPRVQTVTVARVTTAGKVGTFKISFTTKDDNSDKLIYTIDMRKLDKTNWIELKEKLEAVTYNWDGKTVEDGRYEIKVTASDEKSNTTATKLSGSRISDPVIVDNTGPVIKNITSSALKDNGQYRIFEIQVHDELSAIGQLEYTIDSNDDWVGT
ncbi:MAG: flagellar hook assembly protein FlgD, partial [Planctomycetota bacterium]